MSTQGDYLRTSKILFWSFIVWTLFALIEGLVQIRFVNAANGHPLPFNVAIRMPLAYCWFWALASPSIFRAVQKFPMNGRQLRRNVSAHLIWLTVLTALHALYRLPTTSFIYPAMKNPGPVKMFVYYALGNLIDNLFTYCMVAGVAQAIDNLQKYRSNEIKAAQLQTELAQANLQSLKRQIHPHFLFNTLNSISALMREDVEAAEDMMTDLSDLLRVTLDSGDSQEVTVKEELERLEPYLSIQRTRFADRLSVDLQVEEGSLDAFIPTMVIPTLVENSIRHGISPRASTGSVIVQIAKKDRYLEVAVIDDGVGLRGTIEAAFERGIGLKNTKQRLEQLYGGDFIFRLRNRGEAGVEVFFSIPFRTGVQPAVPRHTVSA